jgi:hypothetical protein
VSEILNAARRYRDDRGWKVIPLTEKRPICERYVERKYTVGDFRNRNNVGVVLGSWSDGLVDVDLDAAEAVELADLYLPTTDSVFGRASKPRSHRLYRAVGAVHEVFSDPLIETKKVLLELRSDTAGVGAARHTMFPPSLHPSGEEVRWDVDGEPRVIDAAKLRLACAWLAIGCMVLRYCDEWLPDERLAHRPTLDLPRRICGAWPALEAPIHGWRGLPPPPWMARPPRRQLPDDADVPALVAMIPNDFDREGWVKVGMAIFEAMGAGGYDTFLEFSRRSPNHHNERTVKGRWRSFEKSPPRRMNGLAKLRYLARGGR